MTQSEQLKNIKAALGIIRARYADQLCGCTVQAVALDKVNRALQCNDLDDCSGLVCDLWEACEKQRSTDAQATPGWMLV